MGLRVGLTGGLGSGKSTVAAMLGDKGATILSADEIARSLMQPGEAVYQSIVREFGPGVVMEDGLLNRPELARLAFTDGRSDALNAIVHPATIARQELLAVDVLSADPKAIVIVESALIFETSHGLGWRERFDQLILVTATEQIKVSRFITRSGTADVAALKSQAKLRLARLMPDEEKMALVDFVIENNGSREDLRLRTNEVWTQLRQLI